MMYDLNRGKMVEIYWLNRLSGELPEVCLPSFDHDREKASRQARRRVSLTLKVPPTVAAGLKEVSRDSDMGLFILLLSGLNILLYRYTNLEDLVVGTISPGKEGDKPRLLFCRNRVAGERTFKETINRIKEQVVEDFRHADYSFGEMYRKLLSRNRSRRLNIFGIAFIFEGVQQRSNLLNQFELVTVLSRWKEGLVVTVEYDENRYSRQVIRGFARNWLWLFERLEEKLNLPIGEIDILSPRQHRELAAFNRTHRHFPRHQTIDGLFTGQVEKRADQVAVVGQDGDGSDPLQLTYAELNRQADQLAHLLRQRGAVPQTIVGLLMARSPRMVAAIMGVLKSGAAYLPLDRDMPTGRVVSMLADSRAPLLVSQLPDLSNHAFTSLQELSRGRAPVQVSLPPPRIEDFDRLPFADRSLVDYEKYNRYIGQAIVKNRVLIQAARGCPHNCAYCYRIWPRRQVARSAENILEEIRLYYDLGMRKFDIFMLNLKQGRRMFQMIVDSPLEGLELYFPNGFRGDLLSRDYIDLMVAAGTVNFALALETASPRLQRLINKNLDLDRFRENVEYICRKYPQVILEMFTMHGIPTETEAEARQTLAFIKSLRWLHFPYVNVLKIYHGTGMEKLALKNGISRRAIARSENLAWHEWSETLPFDRSFTARYQSEFLSEYLLSGERLLHVLPHQMKLLTEDEFLQKYDSYFPADINSFADFLKFTGLRPEELTGLQFRDEKEDRTALQGLNQRLIARFPRPRPAADACRILLLDLSQFFSHDCDMLYDVVGPPLGLMYILTYLNRQLGSKVHGKILKSRLDFDSYDELRAVLEDFKPQVIGIRSLSYYRDFFHQTAALLRQWGIDVPIIAGGPYATVDYETLLQDRHIDLAVLGEGEIVFARLIDSIMENRGKLPGSDELRQIPGIAFVADRLSPKQGFARDILLLEHCRRSLPEPAAQNLPRRHGALSPAYCMYTSGSTGKPKGVVVEHRSVVNLVHWFGRTYGLDGHTHVMQMTHHTFDPFVEQVCAALSFGSLICMAPRELAAEPEALARFVRRHQVHIFNFVPRSLRELLDGQERLDCLRAVISGGEKLAEALKNRLLEKGYPLYNQYGPTETTVDALMSRCSAEPVSLGRPIDNVECYVGDAHGHPQPLGVQGELWIGGSGLARGYLNNPELTAEKFVNLAAKLREGTRKIKESQSPIFQTLNPKSQILYRTGDLARFWPDGSVEFLGRSDGQVKVRGQRLEPAEIENRLLDHPGVAEAVVIDRDGHNGDKYLCAYIVPLSTSQTDLLKWREYLSRDLPGYMIPSYFLEVDHLPLSPSGKVDRESLPEPESAGSTNYSAPTDGIEETLCQVWSAVLGLERRKVGIDSNFFELGGDSIKVIQISARLRQHGLKVKSGDIFLYPTVRELKKQVAPLEQEVAQETVEGAVPLSPIQRWFFDQNFADPHHFNQAVMLHAAEGFDDQAVHAVFQKIQQHHDALRLTFSTDHGEIRQFNHGPEYPLSLQIFDWRQQKGGEALLKSTCNKIQAGIDLESGPLMKLALFRLDNGDRLLIVIHHLVMDAVSWRILFGDIESLYQQYLRGEPLELPPKTHSFQTWSEKLRTYANSEPLLQEKEYWRRVAEVEIAEIKKDFNGEENLLRDKANLSFSLDPEETHYLLTGVHEAFGTEIGDLLLTALTLSIRAFWGHRQVPIALESHGRQEILDDVEVSRTVGWFTSVYPVVLDVSSEHDLSRQIKAVKEHLRRVPQRGIGYLILRYLTAPEHKTDLSFEQRPRISFNYLGQFDADLKGKSFEMAGESVGDTHSPRNRLECELEVIGLIANHRLVMSITFSRLQFREQTIQSLLDLYRQKLIQVIFHCRLRKRREPTPSDFTDNRLSIEAVDAIAQSFQENIRDIYPLSPMQEGMLFHTLHNPDSSAYFEQICHRMHGEIDFDKVQVSLNELLTRHDILRTAFVNQGLDRPVQVVLAERRVDFVYRDAVPQLTAGGAGEAGKAVLLTRIKAEDRRRSFDLGRDVLMRITVVRLVPGEYEFIWSHHHIVMDGWSNGILIAEFFEIYNALLQNRARRLPPVQPYRAYIQWLQKQDREKSGAYWSQLLADYEYTAAIPAWKGPEPGEQGYKNEALAFSLSEQESAALEQLAVRSQVTLHTVVQAIWGVVLAVYNGTNDVVFGSVVAGRPADIDQVETMVGLFINTIPVRIRFLEEFTFSQMLRQIQTEAADSEPHHYFPLAEIQSGSQLKQNLFDHILIFENFPVRTQFEKMNAMTVEGEDRVDFKFSRIETFEQTNYHLNVLVLPATKLKLKFEYNGNVYDREVVETVARHVRQAIVQVLDQEEADVDIAAITLLSPQERQQVLTDFNNTGADYPRQRTVPEQFEYQVEKTPEAVALTDPRSAITLSYSWLNRGANRLAHVLRRKGIGASVVVPMMMARTVDMFTAMLAILKAGGAYLPIDPNYPRERINFMLKDSHAPFVLTADALAVQQNEILAGGEGDDNPRSRNQPTDPLHVLYTSGSTGRPRGVVLEHRSVMNFIYDLHRNYYRKFGVRLHLALIAPYVFAGSVKQIFSALLFGHSLLSVPEAGRFDGDVLVDFFLKYAVDIADATPVHLKLIVKALTEREDRRCGLKHLNVSADILSKRLIREFQAVAAPDVPEIANLYGPTECCVDATAAIVSSRKIALLRTVPIGKPMANVCTYILNRHHQPSPIGVKGELYIGGEGVARGYLNNPELTAQKFVNLAAKIREETRSSKNKILNPISYIRYRTDDLCRFLPDGNMEYLGRSDSQVNIRGYRIELGEIQNTLTRHPQIEDSVVTSQLVQGEPRLIAYVKIRSGKTLPTDIREFLNRWLPTYMIPAHFTAIDEIPLKPSGKIDYRALPLPGKGQAKKHEFPANETEEKMLQIWAEILRLPVARIGLGDDFFELGGNSITIFKMRNQIHRVFNFDLPLDALFLYPSVRELAAHIREEAALGGLECIVRLNRGQNRQNIFIIHPMHGMVFPYRELAKLLEDQYNVYGIQARGLLKNSRFPTSLAQMVADYIRQIRQVQPQGPYIIAGHCFGDIVAYHLVWQLEQMNLGVERLVMLDEPAFIPAKVIRYFMRKDRLAIILKPFTWLRDRFRSRVEEDLQNQEWDQPGAAGSSAPEGDFEQRKEHVHAGIKALDKEYWAGSPYRRQPGLIRVPLSVVKARDRQNPGFNLKYLSRMSYGKVQLAESPGTHETLFEPQHVQQLARVIKKLLM
jgi:amino acid adenylation domain-containing protein/non-ribosomal peptide synthase protein (TIGR01720 family)